MLNACEKGPLIGVLQTVLGNEDSDIFLRRPLSLNGLRISTQREPESSTHRQARGPERDKPGAIRRSHIPTISDPPFPTV